MLVDLRLNSAINQISSVICLTFRKYLKKMIQTSIWVILNYASYMYER